MRHARVLVPWIAILSLTVPPGWAAWPDRETHSGQVVAIVKTSLHSAEGHIRQFAFDGSDETYYLSSEPARTTDFFMLEFAKPVRIESMDVLIGLADGRNAPEFVVLDVFSDANVFAPLGTFTSASVRASAGKKMCRAVRIRPKSDMKTPLAIREIKIRSEPPVAVFKYPVEFEVDVSDAPEMGTWANQVAEMCTRAYPMINEELKSSWFKPPTVVKLALRNDYDGVAATSGSRIVGSVKFFKEHPDDIGAMVHETVHVCQRYRDNVPGWLVEGIADYIRFYRFEPGKIRSARARQARYDGSYRISAQFLAYLVRKYDSKLVQKINNSAREGQYNDEIFKTLTGKSLTQLNDEWRRTLPP
jgi:hypothetical protein